MQIHFGDDLLVPEWPRSVVCIGTFDGVHLGHQAVIDVAIAKARELEAPPILVTFDRHPAAVLAPDRRPKAISSIAGNLRMFEARGVSLALVLPFTVELSETSAEAFFESVLIGKLKAHHVVVGYDFAFGRGRAGTPEWLQSRIETTVVPPFLLDGERVSSSRIRAAIASGEFEVAQKLLGRPWALVGIVVPGEKLGRTLGFPTINVARSFDQAMPADGVYAGRCETPFGDFAAAISVGMRPTVNGQSRTIEAYLIDYSGESLYGFSVRLRFWSRLRNEEKFESLEDLKAQMALDVDRVRSLTQR